MVKMYKQMQVSKDRQIQETVCEDSNKIKMLEQTPWAVVRIIIYKWFK